MTKKTQVWMVEQQWSVPGGPTIPIRSVVEASTRREAGRGAADAVVKAVAHLMGGTARGKAVGRPVVHYPIADGHLAKE